MFAAPQLILIATPIIAAALLDMDSFVVFLLFYCAVAFLATSSEGTGRRSKSDADRERKHQRGPGRSAQEPLPSGRASIRPR